MTTVSLADFRANISSLIDRVRDTHERVVVTRHGHADAVLMSVADLESLEETLDILSEPGALEEIREAHAEIERGEFYTMEQIMDEFGSKSE